MPRKVCHLLVSPLLRFICLAVLVAGAFVLLSLPKWHFHKKPVITSISPQVGLPGDNVTITGSGFGEKTADSVSEVEFGGYPFTNSAYIKWTDSEIVVKLPLNVQDGLVFVRTECGMSNPAFFSNAEDVPILVATAQNAPRPVISALSTAQAVVGDVLTISGSGFGTMDVDGQTDGDSGVLALNVIFESAGKRISAPPSMGDIESWTDAQIKVRVADGATTGGVAVQTSNGVSNSMTLAVRTTGGTKSFGDTHTYVVQIAADINGMSADSPSYIRLYFPRPVISSTQISAEIADCIPDEPNEIYQGTSLHTLDTQKGKNSSTGHSKQGKSRYQESYAIVVRSVSVKLNNTQNPPLPGYMNSVVYNAATNADAIVPSTDSRIVQLANEIVQDKKGTATIARTIYNKMLTRFSMTETRTDVCNPVAMLQNGSGDAYDFAIIYCALLRAAGVPSFPCSGVVVDKEMHTSIRWWNVFYVNGVGWVPVDMTVGKLSGEAGFAKLDSSHITFGMGYTPVKCAMKDCNVVQRPKSYSMQSIWEESSKETHKYSSFWSDPIVVGVY